MKTSQGAEAQRIDHLFDSAEARFDRWRILLKACQQWSAMLGTKKAAAQKAACAALLDGILPAEDFHAYPGARLLAMLKERIDGDDAVGATRLAQRISLALMLRSYRRDAAEWEADEDPTGHAIAPPLPTTESGGRPYFEVLYVMPTSPSKWPTHAQQVRRLRRSQDQFIYEPVFVGNLEDAVLATLVNPQIQAVVIHEGFPWASTHELPLLREVLASTSRRRSVLGRRRRPRPRCWRGSSSRSAPRSTSTCSTTAGPRTWSPTRPPAACGACSTRSRSRSRSTSPSSRAWTSATARHTSTTSRSTRRSRSAPSTRCRSRAASRSSGRTGYGTWASSTARPCSSPSPRPRPAASTACSSPPATSSSRRTPRRARSVPTRCSSSPTAPRPRTRWCTRRSASPATSSSSTATATSRTTTAACSPAPSRTTSRRSRSRPTRCTAACRCGRSRRRCST